MAEVTQSGVVRFGQFELDPQSGELRKNGVRLRLQQQPFQVLAELLANAGRIVTREELQRKLWQADTFVDFDVGLNTAIRKLRQTLDDDADHPRYIETVAKRGYRFIAPVAPGNGSTPATYSTTPPPADTAIELPASPPRSHFRWLVVAVVGAIVGAAIALSVWQRFSARPEIRERRLTTNSPENPTDGAAISPDGKYLAYADNTGLYLKVIKTGETHAWSLPNGFSLRPNSWFPDCVHLLAEGIDGPTAQPALWSISVLGGEPRKLADDGMAAAVSPDGLHIAFMRGAQIYYGVSREIWVMSSDGAEQTKLVPSLSGEWLGNIAWSPDSRYIAYIRQRWAGYMQHTSSIEVRDWRSGQSQTLISDDRLGSGLWWLSDRRLVYTLGEDPANQRDSNAWVVKVNSQLKISGAPVRLTH